VRAAIVLLAGSLLVPAGAASAQDLFELEVFEYDGASPGAYEVELHANALSRGTVVPNSIAANHRPAHVSFELTRGWSDRLETALFIQTAPFGSAGSTRFAGGHVRAKVRFGELPTIPLRFGMSAEYAFNRAVFNGELQTIEFRSILDYASGRLSVAVNPALELVLRSSEDEGLEPVFDISARAAWQLAKRLALTGDYFSAAATTRHLLPEVDAHHLVFGGVGVDFATAWEVGVSLGHCVRSSEPWLIKSILGFRF
jgi:hypothetical protein